jgi:hypothetical protein
MPTVRYATHDVVGRRALDDETLQSEFWYWVNFYAK